MNSFVKFFHELLNPHCSHCNALRVQELEQKELDREIGLICNSCENLKIELAKNHQLVNTLLEKLTESPKEEVIEKSSEPPRIIGPSHVPWNVRRQQLESESRKELQRLKDSASQNAAKPDIDKLEKDLGISVEESNGTRTEETA